jgi:branched-subunit amino acid ABC-type transport system permease component
LKISRRDPGFVNVPAIKPIVIFLVLSATGLVLEWTVMGKPNVEHGKMVRYGGYQLVKISAD